MNNEQTLRRLDELIQSRSILQHPFYRAWQRGELNVGQLAVYAKSYYPHVASFPDYLRSAIAASRDAGIRANLESNLADELSNPAPHHELWLDFAAGLGVDRNDVIAAAPTAFASSTVGTFNRLAAGETAGAVAALYAYESQQPAVSKTKMDGLRMHYGVSGTRVLAYFEVHAEKDVEHSEGERQALLRCLETGSREDVVLGSTSDALEAYWGLLNGICKEAGIDAKC